MLIQNKVSFKITDEELKKARDAIAVLNEILLPKLVQLKADDRQQMLKVGDKTITFMTKGFEYAGKNPEYAPGFFNREEAENEFNTVKLLREFAAHLETLCVMIADTMSLSASEAYAAMLTYYNTVKLAAKDRQPGAQVIFDDMKTHFAKAVTAKEAETGKKSE